MSKDSPSPSSAETQRLNDLYSLDILDTAPEERFDRITRLVREVFDAPMALISLVDEHRQWFKSRQGLDISETPRCVALCDHALHESNCLIVPDLSRDPRFASNPLVAGAPYLRFYAGAVLRSSQGRPLGTLCVLDHMPRFFDGQDRALLLQLAGFAERELNEGSRLESVRNALIKEALFEQEGLPGERLFVERCRTTLEQASEAAIVVLGVNEYALQMLDLPADRQDELSRDIARRVGQLFHRARHVGVLGNGRYAALFVPEDATSDQAPVPLTIDPLSLQRVFSKPLHLSQRRVYPTVGVSLYPENGEEIEKLLLKAELTRPSRMKSPARAFSFYSSGEEAALRRNLLIEARLRLALAENRLRLDYQPKFDLATGRLSGLEALLRWSDTELGEVSPAEFIPVAENSDVILELTEWVFTTVCAHFSEWRSQGLADNLDVAINLSAEDLARSDFLPWLQGLLERTSVPPGSIVLELTEGSLIDNVEQAAAHIREAKALGLSVHIDDFGTGYSSLSQLHLLPLDALKVDRSFVQQIGTDFHGETVAKAIISLAKSLKLSVVAEGIESISQLVELRELGCDCVQGFLLSRPVAAGEVATLIHSNADRLSRIPEYEPAPSALSAVASPPVGASHTSQSHPA